MIGISAIAAESQILFKGLYVCVQVAIIITPCLNNKLVQRGKLYCLLGYHNIFVSLYESVYMLKFMIKLCTN